MDSRVGAKTIGVISDTHGLLRPEAVAVLSGCALIIHAGDIGDPAVLDELRKIAPLKVIRGNIDGWAHNLPDDEVVEFDGRYFYVLHNLNDLKLDPAAAGFHAVISGHSHKPDIDHKDGVLYLNPGSAGPRRFTLPIALATIDVEEDGITPTIIELPK